MRASRDVQGVPIETKIATCGSDGVDEIRRRSLSSSRSSSPRGQPSQLLRPPRYRMRPPARPVPTRGGCARSRASAYQVSTGPFGPSLRGRSRPRLVAHSRLSGALLAPGRSASPSPARAEGRRPSSSDLNVTSRARFVTQAMNGEPGSSSMHLDAGRSAWLVKEHKQLSGSRCQPRRRRATTNR
jgi:hypothetical protein